MLLTGGLQSNVVGGSSSMSMGKTMLIGASRRTYAGVLVRER